MTIETIRERLVGMHERIGRWSSKDKSFLRAAVKTLEIEHSFNSGCMNCYDDAFHLCVHKMEMTSADFATGSDEGETESRYYFTASQPVDWHGRYGMVTLDWYTSDDVIEKFIAEFPNQTYFVHK